MKTRFFVLLILLLIAGSTEAQLRIVDLNSHGKSDSIDCGRIRVQYEMQSVEDTLRQPLKKLKDILILEIGRHISKFHSYTAYICDSVLQADIASGASQETINQHLRAYGTGNVSYQIFKNYPEGKVTTTDRLATTNILCEEKTEMPQWTLLSDTMTVLTYHCGKATCHFKGRDYSAWYTMEIPISEGPWKLYGLPGLILKAEDTRGHYSFVCTGLEQCKVNKAILINKAGKEKMSRKDLNKLYERCVKDPMGFIKSTSPNMKVSITDEQGNPVENFSNPYNPIELSD